MIDRPERRRTAALCLSVLAAMVIVASACGSSSSSSDNGPGITVGREATDVTLAANGPPQKGGKFVYGIEAESDGYSPAHNRFAISGTVVGLAIFDPLGAYDVDLNVQPYLAQSFTPSADFMQWTVKVRSGITFQNGQPLDAAAIVKFYEEIQKDALVGIAYKNIASVAVDPSDPLAAVFTMKTPWASFPVYLTGQGGMVPAPEMLDNPDGSRNPIGTGPFKFDEWIPDNHLSASRNPTYWRKDQSGTQLPYLDSVEFRPIPDETTREASVESGTVSMIHTTDPRAFKKFAPLAEQGKVQIVYDRSETEEGFVMLNTAKPPFDNKLARQALAYATDRNQYNDVVNEGLRKEADSIFREGSKWRGNPTYPAYDPTKAAELVQQYQQETGQPLEFTLANSGTDARSTDLLKAQWEAVGMKVNTELQEQSKFIVNAALGDFQAFVWRQFGSPDPDYDYLWWASENANPPGELALNFARNKDPVVDQALQKGRSSTDPNVRKDAYHTVEQQLNDDLAYIWLDRAEWALIANNNVRGITNGPLPDGQEAFPVGGPGGFGGVTFLTQTWLAG